MKVPVEELGTGQELEQALWSSLIHNLTSPPEGGRSCRVCLPVVQRKCGFHSVPFAEMRRGPPEVITLIFYLQNSPKPCYVGTP